MPGPRYPSEITQLVSADLQQRLKNYYGKPKEKRHSAGYVRMQQKAAFLALSWDLKINIYQYFIELPVRRSPKSNNVAEDTAQITTTKWSVLGVCRQMTLEWAPSFYHGKTYAMNGPQTFQYLNVLEQHRQELTWTPIDNRLLKELASHKPCRLLRFTYNMSLTETNSINFAGIRRIHSMISKHDGVLAALVEFSFYTVCFPCAAIGGLPLGADEKPDAPDVWTKVDRDGQWTAIIAMFRELFGGWNVAKSMAAQLGTHVPVIGANEMTLTEVEVKFTEPEEGAEAGMETLVLDEYPGFRRHAGTVLCSHVTLRDRESTDIDHFAAHIRQNWNLETWLP